MIGIFLAIFLGLSLSIFSVGCEDDVLAGEDEEVMMEDEMHDEDEEEEMHAGGDDYTPMDDSTDMIRPDKDDGPTDADSSGNIASFKCSNGVIFDFKAPNEKGYVCEVHFRNTKEYWNAYNEKDYCERRFNNYKKTKGVTCKKI